LCPERYCPPTVNCDVPFGYYPTAWRRWPTTVGYAPVYEGPQEPMLATPPQRPQRPDLEELPPPRLQESRRKPLFLNPAEYRTQP
jgi:hypothetical protein